MVGTHRRLPYADIAAYKERQKAQARRAMNEISRIGEEMGFDEGPPPDKSYFRGGRDK